MTPEGAESWSSIAQTELFGGWRRWLSFTLIWIWSCVAGILSLDPAVIAALQPLLAFGNSLTLLFCVVALACVLLLGRRIATACGSARYIAVGCAFLVAGSAAIALSVFLGQPLLFFLGASCGGVSIGILKVAWGEMFSLMPLKTSMICMGYALIASSTIVLLLRGAPIQLLGILLVVVSLPLGYCLYQGARGLEGYPAEQEAGSARLLLWSIAIPLLVGVSYGAFKVGAPLAPAGGFLSFDIQAAGLWANLCAGIILLAASRFIGLRLTPARIIVCDMIAIVAGLLMLAAPHTSTGAATFVHELGFSLFYFFMIVYWGDLARRMHTPVIFTYTTGYLAMMAAQLVAGVVSAATGEAYISAGDMTLTYVLVFAFVIAIALLAGVSPTTLRRGALSAPDSTQGQMQVNLACERLADAHALTPREREVLDILARGRNASHIAEELVISQDTAKSHIRNIYRKLDIHTQQELLDLVEAPQPVQ